MCEHFAKLTLKEFRFTDVMRELGCTQCYYEFTYPWYIKALYFVLNTALLTALTMLSSLDLRDLGNVPVYLLMCLGYAQVLRVLGYGMYLLTYAIEKKRDWL